MPIVVALVTIQLLVLSRVSPSDSLALDHSLHARYTAGLLYKCDSVLGARSMLGQPRVAECSEKGYLYVCSGKESGCRYRCPLGQPIRVDDHICTDVCPEGYHVERGTDSEVCIRHKACSLDQVTVLEGCTWHDTVCHRRGELSLHELSVPAPPSRGDEVHTMNDVTRAWIRVLPEMVTKELCAKQNATSELCWRDYEHHGNFRDTDSLYIELFSSGFEVHAGDLYRDVIQPFLEQSKIHVNLPDPWWTRDARELLIPAHLTTLAGVLSERQIRNLELMWTAQDSDGTNTTLIHICRGELQRPPVSTCSLGGGEDAFKLLRGYARDSVYLPLVIRDFYCLGQRSLELTLKLKSRLGAGEPLVMKRDIPVNCRWEPAISDQCDCTQALRDYINPLGPCSPACLRGANVLTPESGWMLTVSREPPDPATLRPGRSLFGSSSPRTERFCLVSEFVFDLRHGPADWSPAAPLDIEHCDTTLVDLRVTWKRPASTLGGPRGNNSRESARYPRAMHISANASRTIAAIIRQKWPTRLGIKFHFSVRATRGLVVSVLNWMLQLDRTGRDNRPRFQVAVLQMTVEDVSVQDFQFLQFMYGSELEIVPALRACDLAEVLRTSKRASRGGRAVTQGQASRAEMSLRRLGAVVADHGLFLDTETIGLFARGSSQSNGCNVIRPGRWRLGPAANLSLVVSSTDGFPERTGVILFEEMCRRSNNRAGIVLTIPTARYRQERCSSFEVFNRHTRKGTNDLVYTQAELDEIARDMSKWGVTRYSLGYLDHTYGMSDRDGGSSFKLVSDSVLYHARHRKIHYVYTETSGDGYALYPLTRVYGVYKLDAGIFFQHAGAGPRTEGFGPVQMCGPGIRLGLASEMNLGAEQTGASVTVPDFVNVVHELPYGARTAPLGNPGSFSGTCARHFDRPVAFVGHDNESISVFFGDRRNGGDRLRIAALGTAPGERDAELWPGEVEPGEECYSYVSRAKHTTSITFAQPARLGALVGWLSDHRGPGLSEPDLEQDVPRTSSRNDWSTGLGQVALELGHRMLISHLLACIRGSPFCMAIADYADSWPRGGLGTPTAIETGDSNTTVTFEVYHGSRRFRVPCNLEPFTLGSAEPTVPFTRHPIFTDNGVEAATTQLKHTLVETQMTTRNVLRALDKHYCGEMSVTVPQSPNRAVDDIEKCLSSSAADISRLEKDTSRSSKGAVGPGENIPPAVETLAASVYAISVAGLILSVLINSATAFLVYFAQRGLYRTLGYSKFE